jgi:hypothetical protein
MKVYYPPADNQLASTDKKVFVDFVIYLPSEKSASGFNLFLTSTARDATYATVSPGSVTLSPNKENKFSVSYNCKSLLDKGETYYDTIKVSLSDGTS